METEKAERAATKTGGRTFESYLNARFGMRRWIDAFGIVRRRNFTTQRSRHTLREDHNPVTSKTRSGTFEAGSNRAGFEQRHATLTWSLELRERRKPVAGRDCCCGVLVEGETLDRLWQLEHETCGNAGRCLARRNRRQGAGGQGVVRRLLRGPPCLARPVNGVRGVDPSPSTPPLVSPSHLTRTIFGASPEAFQRRFAQVTWAEGCC